VRFRPPSSSVGREYILRESSPAGAVVTVSPGPGPEVLASWDSLVERTPGTDITQLSAWIRVRRTVGFTALHLMAYRSGDLVGGAQILCRRLRLLGTVGYLPYGPVVDPACADATAVRRALADALCRVRRDHLRMLFVQPAEGDDDVSAALLAHGFRPSTAAIAPSGSIRIDLSEDLAVIRSRFGRRLRSWPNRWECRGVTVTEGGADDVPLLTGLMGDTARRQGFVAPSAAYVHTLYSELAPTGNAALFVGRVRGVPVAADLVTICGGMIRGRLTGFTRCEETAGLSVPAAIRWEIIKWGQARGLRWLDFGGLSPATLDALLDGPSCPLQVPSVDQPKLTFGGTAFRYPQAMEMIAPPPLRLVYDLTLRSRTGRKMIDQVRRSLRRGAIGTARDTDGGRL
jgi:lipid II:glycine glycyltransferase (peptidoglycan interpeptide bridge formation enzyme)